ncbi:MAG: hypothetical protein Fur0028_00160 [Bacteroidales bacterium]
MIDMEEILLNEKTRKIINKKPSFFLRFGIYFTTMLLILTILLMFVIKINISIPVKEIKNDGKQLLIDLQHYKKIKRQNTIKIYDNTQNQIYTYNIINCLVYNNNVEITLSSTFCSNTMNNYSIIIQDIPLIKVIGFED